MRDKVSIFTLRRRLVHHFSNGTSMTEDYSYTYDGWYDFGARWYDTKFARWTTPDPLAEKYYAISPYVYCAGNPVNLVDPDGKVITIKQTDENGNITCYDYYMGAYYAGDDFISRVVNSLNYIIANGGWEVIDQLVNSDTIYSYTDDIYEYNGYPVHAYKDGKLYLGNINKLGDDYITQTESVAHESFHAFQDEKGQGGSISLVVNEVEANVFAGRIQNNVASLLEKPSSTPPSARGNETKYGEAYGEAIYKLIYHESFDLNAFHDAVKYFKLGNDAGNIYNNYSNSLKYYKNYLIKPSFPKIKY